MSEAQVVNPVAEKFLEAVEDFNRRGHALGYTDIENYYWYHTIELPGGLITPGLYDLRESLPNFPFPMDMRGMSVLDVGTATGFFAFEFARRGARVTAVDLPSLQLLDRFPGQAIEHSIEKIGEMIVPRSIGQARSYVRKYTAEQLYFYLLEGPFEFCRKLLGVPVNRHLSTVYELSEARLGQFDLVFLGDILVHTLYPLQALAAAAALCSGTLVLSQIMPEKPGEEPAMLYIGGDSATSDEVSWWLPNKTCMVQLLKKLGFGQVSEVGRNTGVLRPSGYAYDRAILQAVR